jgi:phage terminase small subunit
MSKILTAKQKRFCDEYIKEGNATSSYISVYKVRSESGAASSASLLLRNPKVAAYLAEISSKLQKKTDITHELVLAEYAKIAFRDPRKMFDAQGNMIHVAKMDEGNAAALAGVEMGSYQTRGGRQKSFVKRIKQTEKRAALDSICRMLGYNAPDKHEHTGKDGGPIATETRIIKATLNIT